MLSRRSVLLLLILVTASSSQGLFWDTAIRRFRRLLQDPEGLTYDIPTSQLNSEYDFIVIGAGTGGATVTNRLTEVPKWSVLLLEAGGDESAITDVPLLAPALSRTFYNWGYNAVPQDNACLAFVNGSCFCMKGKGMGGSSATNYMLYTRGHPRDYDEWAQMGNPGWSYQEVLPYFLKSENMREPEFKNSPFHSTGGYLDIMTVPYESKVSKVVFKGAQQAGYPMIDYNSDKLIGFSRLQVTMRKGRRCSSNKAFLRPIRDRPNLDVAKNTHVTKILINPETRKAYGVEFQRGGKRWSVKARKEVILSAGAINTPQILMLSGIGPKDHLDTLKIPVIQDLQGVGANMQDHISSFMPIKVNDSITTVALKVMADVRAYTDYLKGKGPFTLAGGAEGIGFIRTPLARTPIDYPDVEFIISPGHPGSGSAFISSRVLGLRARSFVPVYAPISFDNVFSLSAMLLLPESRGWIRLRDKSPFTPPLIYNNYFSDPHDIATMVEGFKFILALTQSDALQKYNAKIHDIPQPGCQHLTFATDEYWECAIRHITISLGHHSGTAKMGPNYDPWAVVDPELRVYGVKGLRVVDASIFPRIIAGHTNAPVFMIGEKAGDLIKKSYGKG